MLINEIDESNYQATVDPDINLNENKKTQYDNKWCTHRERVAILEKQRGKAFSMVKSQCTQILMENMKHNPKWYTTSTRYDPLKLMALIEKNILAQTEKRYPFDIVYEQKVDVYSSHQQEPTNNQCYESFNNKVDIRSAIWVTR